MKALHSVITKLKSPMPILNLARSNGKLLSTNLNVWLETETDLSEGIYNVIETKKSAEFVLSNESEDDFPSLFLDDLNGSLQFNADNIFFNYLFSSIDFTDKSDIRPAFQCVCLDHQGSNIVATNGHILKINSYGLPKSDLQVLLNNKDLLLFKKIVSKSKLKDLTCYISYYQEKNRVKFVLFDFLFFKVYIRTVDAVYPKYLSVIALNADKQVIFNRLDLIDKIEQLSPFATCFSEEFNHKDKQIMFDASSDFSLYADNLDLNIKKSLPIQKEFITGFEYNVKHMDLIYLMPIRIRDHKEDTNSFGFAINYLLLCLRNLSGEFVYISYNKNTQGFRLTSYRVYDEKN